MHSLGLRLTTQLTRLTEVDCTAHDAVQSLGCCGWVLGHCYAVYRVLLLVARALPCSHYSVVGGC